MNKKIIVILLINLIFYTLLYGTENKNFIKGLELYNQKKFLQAINFFKKAIEEGYEDPKCYFYLANSYLNNGEYEKSIDLFLNSQKITKSLIFNSYIYHNLGYAYYLKKDYDNSIKYFDEAYKINNKLSRIFWFKGMAYYNKMDKENTINSWKKYLELEPNGPESENIRKAIEILNSSNFTFTFNIEKKSGSILDENYNKDNNESLIDIEGVLGEKIIKDKEKVEDDSFESIER